MKAKVLRAFIDAETKEYREVGQTVEVTEERFAEINEALGVKFLDAVLEPEKPEDGQTEPEGEKQPSEEATAPAEAKQEAPKTRRTRKKSAE